MWYSEGNISWWKYEWRFILRVMRYFVPGRRHGYQLEWRRPSPRPSKLQIKAVAVKTWPTTGRYFYLLRRQLLTILFLLLIWPWLLLLVAHIDTNIVLCFLLRQTEGRWEAGDVCVLISVGYYKHFLSGGWSKHFRKVFISGFSDQYFLALLFTDVRKVDAQQARNRSREE